MVFLRILFFIGLVLLTGITALQYGPTALLAVAAVVAVLLVLLNLTINPEQGDEEHPENKIRLRPEAMLNLLAKQVQQIATSKLKLGVVCLGIGLYLLVLTGANLVQFFVDLLPEIAISSGGPADKDIPTSESINRRNLSLDASVDETRKTPVSWNFDSLIRQGRRQEKDKMPDQALESYKTALKWAPDDPWLNTRIGALYVVRNEPDTALPYLKTALAQNPSSEFALFTYGEALFVQGQYKESLAYFSKTISLNPENAAAYNEYGIALSRQEKHQEALPYFQKAIASNPHQFPDDYSYVTYKRSDPYINYAQSLIKTGDCEHARPYLTKFVEINPEKAFEIGLKTGQNTDQDIANYLDLACFKVELEQIGKRSF